jgi:hypothetical protein
MTAPADTARSTRLTRLAAARPFRFAISLLCLLAISAEAAVAATFADLVGEAFKRSQTPWDPRTPAPVVEFDPPDGSDPLGLDFVEYGKLMARPFHDDYIWWVRASPRGNFEKDPLELWTYQPERKGHAPVPYRAEDFPYRHPAIRPPLPDPIPVAARHISAVDLGFRRENPESWPQILHLGGNGYGRLAGFPPLVFGTSFRLGVRHIGQPNEDFAKLRKLYLQPLNERAFRLMGLVDCQAYAAALAATLQPGAASTLRVNMTIFLRQPLRLADDPSLGPLGLSSMFWKDETATRGNPGDEAHDADRFIVWYPDGRRREQQLAIPNDPTESPLVADFGEVTDFALVQSDRNPAHYQRYASVDYPNRVSLLISDITSSLPYTVGLWQSYTDYEGADNIAVYVRFNRNVERPASINEGITFAYTLTAYR